MSSRSCASYAVESKGYTSSSTHPSTSSSYTPSNQTKYATSCRGSKHSKKPPVVISQGGQSNDPNTSTSAPNSGYYN